MNKELKIKNDKIFSEVDKKPLNNFLRLFSVVFE